MKKNKSYSEIISEIKSLAEHEQMINALKGKFYDLEKIVQNEEHIEGKIYKSSKTRKQKSVPHKEPNKPINKQPKWAKKHDRCIKCKRKKWPHRGRGLCSKCYELDNRRKHKYKITFKERKQRSKPEKEQPYELYIVQQMSVREVGQKLRYAPARISQLLKKYNLPARTQSEARTIAYDKRKISHKKSQSYLKRFST